MASLPPSPHFQIRPVTSKFMDMASSKVLSRAAPAQPTVRAQEPTKKASVMLDHARLLELLHLAPCVDQHPAVFVCMDLETHEFDDKKVLELGIAVVDAADLMFVPPGDRGKNWRPLLTHHHLLASEYKHLSNRKHCPGNPDGFLFGDTQLMSKQAFADYTERLMRFLAGQDDGSSRPLILVGHSFHDDEKILGRLGFKQWPPQGYAGTVDTQQLTKALIPERFNGLAGLSRLLEALGIPYAKLHNGANDAAFTLQAMLALAVLSDEQIAYLRTPPPSLPISARSWGGDVESEIEIKVGKKKTLIKQQAQASGAPTHFPQFGVPTSLIGLAPVPLPEIQSDETIAASTKSPHLDVPTDLVSPPADLRARIQSDESLARIAFVDTKGEDTRRDRSTSSASVQYLGQAPFKGSHHHKPLRNAPRGPAADRNSVRATQRPNERSISTHPDRVAMIGRQDVSDPALSRLPTVGQLPKQTRREYLNYMLNMHSHYMRSPDLRMSLAQYLHAMSVSYGVDDSNNVAWISTDASGYYKLHYGTLLAVEPETSDSGMRRGTGSNQEPLAPHRRQRFQAAQVTPESGEILHEKSVNPSTNSLNRDSRPSNDDQFNDASSMESVVFVSERVKDTTNHDHGYMQVSQAGKRPSFDEGFGHESKRRKSTEVRRPFYPDHYDPLYPDRWRARPRVDPLYPDHWPNPIDFERPQWIEGGRYYKVVPTGYGGSKVIRSDEP